MTLEDGDDHSTRLASAYVMMTAAWQFDTIVMPCAPKLWSEVIDVTASRGPATDAAGLESDASFMPL